MTASVAAAYPSGLPDPPKPRRRRERCAEPGCGRQRLVGAALRAGHWETPLHQLTSTDAQRRAAMGWEED